jgi:hypothetical protein
MGRKARAPRVVVAEQGAERRGRPVGEVALGDDGVGDGGAVIAPGPEEPGEVDNGRHARRPQEDPEPGPARARAEGQVAQAEGRDGDAPIGPGPHQPPPGEPQGEPSPRPIARRQRGRPREEEGGGCRVSMPLTEKPTDLTSRIRKAARAHHEGPRRPPSSRRHRASRRMFDAASAAMPSARNAQIAEWYDRDPVARWQSAGRSTPSGEVKPWTRSPLLEDQSPARRQVLAVPERDEEVFPDVIGVGRVAEGRGDRADQHERFRRLERAIATRRCAHGLAG